jgi:chromosome segregation ATPase
MFDIFGNKRAELSEKNERQSGMIEELTNNLDQFELANRQMADQYAELLATNNKMTEVASEKTRQLAALKEEALTRVAQIDSMMTLRDANTEKLYLTQAKVEELEDQVSDLGQEEGTLADRNASQKAQIIGLEGGLVESRDDACELTRQRDAVQKQLEDSHARLVNANNTLDQCYEWIGTWAKLALVRGNVPLKELRQIADGWACADGRYPWEDE